MTTVSTSVSPTSKMARARELFATIQGDSTIEKPRATFIERAQTELGMSKNYAATSYFNLTLQSRGENPYKYSRRATSHKRWRVVDPTSNKVVASYDSRRAARAAKGDGQVVRDGLR